MTETFIHIWHKILESNLFNFVLMLVFLNWILNKCAIADKLEAGRKSIEDKIRNSKTQKEEALKTLYELQEKTQEVDKEAHDILAKSNENAVMVGEKIIADAKKQAQEFGKNLDKVIESGQKAVQNSLTEETAKKSVQLAQDYIQKRLDEDRTLHVKFMKESIKDLNGVEF